MRSESLFFYLAKQRGSSEARAAHTGQELPFTVWQSDQITVKFMEGRDHDWLTAAFTYGANETQSTAALEVTSQSAIVLVSIQMHLRQGVCRTGVCVNKPFVSFLKLVFATFRMNLSIFFISPMGSRYR